MRGTQHRLERHVEINDFEEQTNGYKNVNLLKFRCFYIGIWGSLELFLLKECGFAFHR